MRIGMGVSRGTDVGRDLFEALDIAAFKRSDRFGLIPHARHGGSGVWSLAIAGSKFDGTRLE